MDKLRNIISNLYFYKLNYNDYDYLNYNRQDINSIKDYIDFQEEIENEKSFIKFKDSPIKLITNVDNNYKINNINYKNNRNRYQRIDNYNMRYITIKNNNLQKNKVNHILKNKELVKSQENQMKLSKLEKENEALKLLLRNKNKNFNGVRSRLMDYEIKQKQNKNNILKRNKINNRYFSSQKPNRRRISINNTNNKEYESINVNVNKKKNNFTKSLKLPLIPIKQVSSPLFDGLPELHKNYGKVPDYLEKRKMEIEEENHQEIIRKKEKRLPSGYRILSEEERKERLDNLRKREKELEDELYSFPIAILTNKQKKRKEMIDKEFLEIEEKIQKLIGYKEVIVKE